MAPLSSRALLLSVTFAILVLCTVPALGGPPRPDNGPGGRRCKRIDHRKEWRDMPIPQRKAWSQAVLCLHAKPPTNPWGNPATRFDQFAAVHLQLEPMIHRVGQFLPWHREFVRLFSKALRDECGYKGPTPYWDWSRDADTSNPISESPLFDPVHGFGGDGVPGTYTPPADLTLPWTAKGCIDSGPFKDMITNIGPSTFNDPHCIARGFNETGWRQHMTSAAIAAALRVEPFVAFNEHVDNESFGIHHGGHRYIGGDMMMGSSPVDPIFYLHHAQLDRVWWQWQRANPRKRLYDMGGPTIGFPEINNLTTTLDTPMIFEGIGENITVRDAMDASAYPNCFAY